MRKSNGIGHKALGGVGSAVGLAAASVLVALVVVAFYPYVSKSPTEAASSLAAPNQDPSYPNRPPGFADTVLFQDGTDSVLARPAEADETMPGWYDHVTVVEDPGNPLGTGSAMHLQWSSPRRAPGLTRDDRFSSVYREWYISYRIYIDSLEAEGFKWMYLGTNRDGSDQGADQLYFTHEADRGMLLTKQGAPPTRNLCDTRRNDAFRFSNGAAFHIEFHLVSESSPEADDGEAYCYANGRAVGAATDINWSETHTGFDGIFWWPQSNDATNSQESYKVRELLIVGKN